jgi:MerR family Zn(II)-responsive transcriptional regulator of zntA
MGVPRDCVFMPNKNVEETVMYTIGRLARRARVKPDSIRYYERQGLIVAVTKTPAGYHLYTDATLRRLKFIKYAQHCGLSLAEIGKLLDMHGPTAENAPRLYQLLAEKKKQIDASIEMLRVMSQALASLLLPLPDSNGTCKPDAPRATDDCPALAALEASLTQRESQNCVIPISAAARDRARSSLYV